MRIIRNISLCGGVLFAPFQSSFAMQASTIINFYIALDQNIQESSQELLKAFSEYLDELFSEDKKKLRELKKYSRIF